MSAPANATATASNAAARFVEGFAAGWAAGRDGFFDVFLPALVDEEIVLVQPLTPAVRGHAGFRAQFEALFRALPDLRGEVRDWRPTGEGVEIDVALRGTLEGVPVRLLSHDRIVLREGRMVERRARIDLRPLLRAALRRPRTGLPLLLAPLRGRLSR